MNNGTFRRALLNGGAALQAIAIVGAGAVVSMAAVAPAYAQDYTNVSASGKVITTSGKGISGATVSYKSNSQGFTRTVKTDSSGSFRIGQLPTGIYTVTIEVDGYETYTADDVNISIDDAANQFALVATGGAGSGDIVVTAGRIKVADFDRTTTGAVIDVSDLATRVPVARSISSLVQLSPGTTAGDAGFGDQPNIAGASVAENAFYLNGLNITNFRTGLGAVAVPFDFYRTVEVKNGGFQAEFGRATGGVINAVTKSGSNDYHGGVTVNWEPKGLSSNRPNTIFEDNDVRGTERKDVIAQLSGPIIKDRLFLYGIYNFRNVETTRAFQALAPGATPANPSFLGTQYYTDVNKSPFYGAKLDGIITDGHRIELTYFNTSSSTLRTVFGTPASGTRYNPTTNNPGAFDSQTVFKTGGENYVARYTGTFAPWITLSAAYGKNKDRDTTESTQTNRSSIIDERSGTPVSIGNGTANSDLSNDQRVFYRGDVDLYFNILGSHHIRGGYDREDLSTDIVTLSNGGGQFTYAAGSAADPFGFTSGQYALKRFFQNGGNFKSQNVAFYIQDNWSLFDNRLTLQLGVRNDKFENKNIAGTPYYKSGNQWGPRLGFSGDVFGDGKTKVYGSFGRYYLPIAANTNNRLGGAELDYDQFFVLNSVNADGTPNLGARLTPTGGATCPAGVTGSCIIRSDGKPGDIKSLIAGNLKSQTLDEYILGAEHRFGGGFRVGVFFTKRDLTSTLEDAAVDAAIRTYCTANNLNGVANADGDTCQTIFNGTHQYVLLNPGSPSTITLSDPVNGETTLRTVNFTAAQLGIPDAVRKYKAITLQADRAFDGVWSLAGSYTWSSLKGNTEGGVRSDNDQDDTGATVDFDLPGLADGTFGFSPNHRRHNLKIYGSYAPTSWLTLGFNASVTSPRKFGCLGTVPASRDPDANALYGANGTYCNLNADGSVRTAPAAPGEVLPARRIVQRGTAFDGDWQKILDLDATFKLPTDAFEGMFRVSVTNVFNSQAKIDFEERGTLGSGAPRITYGQVRGYQAPRTVRLQFGVSF
jgi:Carboxypeptidase regulatory-like domain/TonB-dependent Receptor Plug Domain